MHPFDEQADTGGASNTDRRDPGTGPQDVADAERGSLRATWTLGSDIARDHGGLGAPTGQSALTKGFDFDREVMDATVRDFHLEFEMPHGESAR